LVQRSVIYLAVLVLHITGGVPVHIAGHGGAVGVVPTLWFLIICYNDCVKGGKLSYPRWLGRGLPYHQKENIMTTFKLKVLSEATATSMSTYSTAADKLEKAKGTNESATSLLVSALLADGIDCVEKMSDPKAKGSLTSPEVFGDLKAICFPMLTAKVQKLAETNLATIPVQLGDGTANPDYTAVYNAKKQTTAKLKDIRNACKKVWRAAELLAMSEDEREVAIELDELAKYKAKQAAQEKKAPDVFTESELALVAPAFHLIAKVLAAKNMAPVEDDLLSDPSH